MVHWLVGQEERFRGDVGFVKALLHIAEGARDLHSISDHIETRWFPAGTFVVEQGEAATTLYLILSGEAEAVREFDDGSIEILGRLEPGQFFGEMGIAAGKPRNAHVIARTDLTCLEFSPAEPAPIPGARRGSRSHRPGPGAGARSGRARGGDHAHRHRRRHRSQDRGDRGLSESIRVPARADPDLTPAGPLWSRVFRAGSPTARPRNRDHVGNHPMAVRRVLRQFPPR